MGEKNIFGEDMDELHRREHMSRQTDAAEGAAAELSEIRWLEQSRESARIKEETDRLIKDLEDRSMLAAAAGESMARALELNPRLEELIVEKVLEHIGESTILGPIARLNWGRLKRYPAKPGDKINLDGIFLGMDEAGTCFKPAGKSLWGEAYLIADFKYFCVTREAFPPHIFRIMDKVLLDPRETLGSREVLGEFFEAACEKPLPSRLQGKCESLRDALVSQRTAKEAELAKIRASMAAIKRKFERERRAPYKAIALICGAMLFAFVSVVLLIVSRTATTRTPAVYRPLSEGNSALTRQDFQTAIFHFEKAKTSFSRTKNPNEAAADFGLGVAYLGKGDWVQAAQNFERVRDLWEGKVLQGVNMGELFFEVHKGLARAYHEQGKRDKAEKSLRFLLLRSPDDPTVVSLKKAIRPRSKIPRGSN